MMITNMDLIKAKLSHSRAASESDIIKHIIEEDERSKEKDNMRLGERYYKGEHDILNKDFRYSVVYEDDSPAGINAGGTPIINENNSNHHNVHNFHAILVDQKKGYVVGKAPSVTVEGADKNNELKAFEDKVTAATSDEDFSDNLADLVTGASNKGVEWLHPYYETKGGSLRFAIVSAVEVIAFWDTSLQKHLTDVIRYYPITVIADGEEKQRKRVEWWTANDVSYYTEDSKGKFVLELRRPHWYDTTKIDGVETERTARSWGRVPFIPLFNNTLRLGDLNKIKGLQDAYNLISSSATNNQIDLVELYWLIQGYGGETAKAIRQKLQINKAAHISDPNGKISAEQVNLSVSERIAWLDLLRKDIYQVGMGIDTERESIGSSPSGVALKFLYTHLDLKADPLISKLKKALKEVAWYITEDINIKNGTNYDYTLVKFDINKTMIVNESEQVTMIEQSRGLVPDKMLLAKHPFVDDAAQAYEELTRQKQQEMDMVVGDDSANEGDE